MAAFKGLILQLKLTLILILYKIPEAAKALADFVDEMSNWYVPPWT